MAFSEKKKEKQFRIKMISDTRGFPDGITSVLYKKNEIYIVNESMFKGFLSLAACELVEDEKPATIEKSLIINPVAETAIINPVEEIKIIKKAKKKTKK